MGLISVMPSRATFDAASLVSAMPPLAVIAPDPLSVPPVIVSKPVTVMAPLTVSVPPEIVRPPPIVDAEAIDSVPPLIDSGPVVVKLLIVSVTSFGWTTAAVVSIVTSALDPGTLSVLQFPGVSQLSSPASPVQVTAESRVRPSIHSSRGREYLDRRRWAKSLACDSCRRIATTPFLHESALRRDQVAIRLEKGHPSVGTLG